MQMIVWNEKYCETLSDFNSAGFVYLSIFENNDKI